MGSWRLLFTFGSFFFLTLGIFGSLGSLGDPWIMRFPGDLGPRIALTAVYSPFAERL